MPFAPLVTPLQPNPFLQVLAQGQQQQQGLADINVSQQLQNAQAMRIARGQSSMPSAGPRGTAPVTAAVQTAKQLMLKSLLGGEDEQDSELAQMPEDQRGQIRQLTNDPNVPLNEYEGILQKVKVGQQTKRQAMLAAEKEKSFQPAVSPSDKKLPGMSVIGPTGQFQYIASAPAPSPRQQAIEELKDKLDDNSYKMLQNMATNRSITDASFYEKVSQFTGVASKAQEQQAKEKQKRIQFTPQDADGLTPREQYVERWKDKLTPETYENFKAEAQDESITFPQLQQHVTRGVADLSSETRRYEHEAKMEQEKGQKEVRQHIMDSIKNAEKEVKELDDKYKISGGLVNPLIVDTNTDKEFVADHSRRKELTQQIGQLRQQLVSTTSQGTTPATKGQTKYEEGRTYTSASTGRKFRYQNGQLVEIGNAE